MKYRRKKTVLIISDPHFGSEVGLWPPDFEYDKEINEVQLEIHGLLSGVIDLYKRFDYMISLGDLVEGRIKNQRVFCSDKLKQATAAKDILNWIPATKKIIVRGTDAHVKLECGAQVEDWIADNINGVVIKDAVGDKVHDMLFAEINGVVIYARHHIGNSTVPYGGLTPVYRETVWNAINSAWGDDPAADIILRAHVHRFEKGEIYPGGKKKTFATMPALKARGCHYGNTRCTGRVDVGVCVIEIDENGNYELKPYIKTVANRKAKLIKI